MATNQDYFLAEAVRLNKPKLFDLISRNTLSEDWIAAVNWYMKWFSHEGNKFETKSDYKRVYYKLERCKQHARTIIALKYW